MNLHVHRGNRCVCDCVCAPVCRSECLAHMHAYVCVCVCVCVCCWCVHTCWVESAVGVCNRDHCSSELHSGPSQAAEVGCEDLGAPGEADQPRVKNCLGGIS